LHIEDNEENSEFIEDRKIRRKITYKTQQVQKLEVKGKLPDQEVNLETYDTEIKKSFDKDMCTSKQMLNEKKSSEKI
jgi:hypothetical protein